MWCWVANIVETRPYGPGGAITKRGTYIFPGGTKVYLTGHHHCIPPVAVVGLSRRPRRWASADVHVRYLVNWRLRMVYSPAVAGAIFRARSALDLPYWYRRARHLGAFDVIDLTSDDYREYLVELGALIERVTANPWR